MYLRKLGSSLTQDDVYNIAAVDPLLGRGCYTPELAAALEAIGFKTGTVSFPVNAANARAKAMEQATGTIKVIADAKTDRILGVHVIGNNASELIAEAVVAMEFGAASEDLARICHAHPTLSEAMHEAALAVEKRALHF